MLTPDSLYIYQFNLMDLPAAKSSALTAFEHNKLTQLTAGAACQYQKTRYILRHLLQHHHIPPDSLTYTDKGKIILTSLPSPIAMSLTHSEQYWYVGLMGATNLGIDLQITAPKNPQLLLKRCQLPLTTSMEDLLKHWCLCEAYCKLKPTSLLAILQHPIQNIMNQQGLYYQYFPDTQFAAVATSPIKDTYFLDGKNQLFGSNQT